jgi:flagellar basal body-associated protein FliL
MAAETPEEVVKPKKSILSILKLVATILAVIVFVITAISNLAVVYIVFAPDNFPKPFYLVYYIPGQDPQIPIASETGTTEQTSTSSSETETTTENGAAEVWTEVQSGQGITLDTGTKIVNLVDPGGRKFIRTNVVLEFAPNDPVYFSTETASSGEEGSSMSPSQAYAQEFLTELEGKLPIINDAIITLLSTKSFDDVYTAEGKDILRNEIMQAVNSRLTEYHVIYVYFTEFVMQ